MAEAKSSISAMLGPNMEHGEVSHSEYAHELLEKVLHDNALDLLVKHLTHQNLLLSSLKSIKTGDFVLCSFPMEAFDLDFLTKLLEKSTTTLISEVTTFSLIDKMEKEASLKNAALSKNRREQIISEEENKISHEGKTAKYIKAIKTISPYSQFLYTANAIVPLKSEYLRETLSEIAFKYSGDICLLGRVTRKKDTKNKSVAIDPSFTNLLELAFDVATSMYKGGDKNIVTPIALFFE